MSDVVSIRRDVEVQFDAEREMIDFATTKVRAFVEELGAPPTRIVIVLMGQAGDDEAGFTTNYWDSECRRTPSELMGHAIALLTRRVSQ